MTDSGAVLNSADRFFAFVETIRTIIVVQDAGKPISHYPYGEGIVKLSSALEFTSFADFSHTYGTLRRDVEKGIELLPFSREEARTSLIQQVRQFDDLLNPANANVRTDAVLTKVFDPVSMAALHQVSDRLASAEYSEASEEELTLAFKDAVELANVCRDAGQLSSKAAGLIKLHLRHLEQILARYDDYGEEDFWDSYRVLFASFLQLHEQFYGENSQAKEQDKYREKLKAMMRRLMTGSNLASNAITIGSVAFALLK